MDKNLKIVSWVLRVALAAGFIAMGALPKLTGDAMSIELFQKLGAEPAGRYAVGFFELLTAVLLLIPKTGVYGGIVGVGLMLGALGSHIIGPLGFPMTEVTNPETNELEEMPLGIFAVVFFLISAAVVFLNRDTLPFMKGGSGAGSPPAA